MKTNNVIQFPKEQTTRVRLRDRNGQQKAVLALSILSVLMLSVLSNQWLTRTETAQAGSGGRGIASFSPVNSKSEIVWEHELAKELSRSNGMAAHLAVKPSLREELIYGSLEGRYGMKLAGDKIESLELIQAHAGDDALAIKDRGAFLRQFRTAFSMNYQEAGLSGMQDGAEVWNLIDENKAIVGQAVFALDAKGHMTSLKFKK